MKQCDISLLPLVAMGPGNDYPVPHQPGVEGVTYRSDVSRRESLVPSSPLTSCQGLQEV